MNGETSSRKTQRPKNSATNFPVAGWNNADGSFVNFKVSSGKRTEYVQNNTGYDGFSKVTSNPSFKSTQTFSQNLAQRTEIVNNYLLGNMIT